MGGHNHINMNIEMEGVNFITVSALSEVPFEFKVCEITSDQIAMSTISLQDSLTLAKHYDFNKIFVQGGRGKDRAFSRALGMHPGLNPDIQPTS